MHSHMPSRWNLRKMLSTVERGGKRAARQIPPGAARAQEIEDRVHRRAHVSLARPTARLGRRD
jgi:hypothetical protein